MLTLLDLFSENNQIKKWHRNLTDKKRQLNVKACQLLQKL